MHHVTLPGGASMPTFGLGTWGMGERDARRSDMVAVVPHSCLGNVFAPDHAGANGLQWFALPVSPPAFNVSAIWHPRLDHDPGHRWLRAQVLELCLAAYPRDPIAISPSPTA